MDPYSTLGIARGCTRQEAKDAFRARAWRLHPDHGGEEQAFIELYTAYKQILRELDRTRSGTAGDPPPAGGHWRDAHLVDPGSDPDIIVLGTSSHAPHPPRPPDPSWEPELILLDVPRPPPQPFDPNWDPELIVHDLPHSGAEPPESTSARGDLSSWLLEVSERSVSGDVSERLARISVLVAAILLILVIVSVVLSWTLWGPQVPHTDSWLLLPIRETRLV